jgi:2-dehydropantoate 2-reductase
MKICVFGAGAVGGNLAVRLAAAGNEVSVIARGAHLAAIRENGLVLEAGEQRMVQRVRASDRAADLGAQDLVLCTLKANSLPALAAGVAPLLGPDTAVVFSQNGIPWWYAYGASNSRAMPDLSFLDPGGALARAIALPRIVAGIPNSANAVLRPGVIFNSSPQQNRILLGEPAGGSSARLVALRAVLSRAGIDSPPVADLRREIWQKLLSNLVTGLTVLVEEATSEMLADEALAQMARRVVDEGVAIAAACGITLQALMPSVPVGKKSSILQDYEAGRPMEVDAQYRAPVAFARAAGVPVPVLEAASALIAHRAAAKGLYRKA